MRNIDLMICLSGASYPILLILQYINPELFASILLIESLDIALALKAPLILLATIVIPQYYFTVKTKSQEMLDLIIVQRLLILPLVTLVYLLQGPDTLPIVRVMLLFDVLPAMPMIYMSGDGLPGLFERLFFKHCGISQEKGLEVYASLFFSALALAYTSVVYNHVILCGVIVYIAIFISAMGQWGLIVARKEQYRRAEAACCIVGLLLVSELLQITPEPLRFHAITQALILVGRPYSLGSSVVQFFYFSLKLFFYLGGVQDGLFYMMIGWSLATISLSCGWVFFFWYSYDESQQMFLRRIHFQDWTMFIMTLALAGAMRKLEILEHGKVGYWPSFVISFSLFQFTGQTKNLIHRRVGAPHHPSWWVDGIVPMQDPNCDAVNVAFALTTAIATVGNVLLCLVIGYAAIGIDQLAFSAPSLWKFLVFHGFLLIGYSGFWMIFATSGLPPNGFSKLARLTSPPGWTNGAIMYVDPKNALTPHKFDIVTGLACCCIGAFCVGSDLSTRDDYLLRVMTVMFWTISLPWKIWVHYNDYGYFPAHKPNPYEEFVRKDNEAAAKKRS